MFQTSRPALILIGTLLALGFAWNALFSAQAWPAAASETAWRTLETGLDLGSFGGPEAGNPLRVLRIDPAHFDFKLLNASHSEAGKPLSAREWVRRHGLVAAINASMYQADHMTSVSLMQTRDHVNNTWFSRDKALLAFDPLSASMPPVQILDRDCQNVPKLRDQYQTLIQSIRMISCDGKNVWAQQPQKKWSAAAIGQDASGRVLFIHSRSLVTTHDLIEHLLGLPLDLKRAMYVEGGPESQLYIKGADEEWEFVGNFNYNEPGDAGNTIGWPVPNVVGIVRHSGP